MGKRLRELRQSADLSGRQLAESLSWPPSKISKLENGRQTPSDDDVRVWTRATNSEVVGEHLGPAAQSGAVERLPERAREVVEYRKSGLRLNHIQVSPLDCVYCIRHTYGLWDQRQSVVDQRDLSMSILDQFNHISQDVGDFTAGILSNDISKEDQIAFVQRLVSLAVTIRDRAEGTAGLVVEGSVIDEGGTSAGRELLPSEG